MAQTTTTTKTITAATLIRYPQRNQEWLQHADGSFSTEASTNDANGGKDPWNRQLLAIGEPQRDGEGEVTHWIGYTTVAGELVTLIIFND
jgi:hypothetical protein